ncbi:MAG: putative lipoprotein YajG [Halocynthiibacter sp.]|jgi:hypothetical protein
MTHRFRPHARPALAALLAGAFALAACQPFGQSLGQKPQQTAASEADQKPSFGQSLKESLKESTAKTFGNQNEMPTVIRIGEGTIDPLNAPPNAKPGACYARDITPAVIETVTEQIVATPAITAENGTITQGASYRTETHQRIVKERTDIWIETPCDEVQTIEFTATLQRALKARGFYKGKITAIPDPRTRRAIRAYQITQGLDSAVLSTESATKLGLIAVAR